MTQDPEAIDIEDGEPAAADSKADAKSTSGFGPEAPATDQAEAADQGVTSDEPRTPDIDASAQVVAELEQVRDRHLRLAAEFDNYRKRMDNELTGAWARAQADLVSRLLDGLDDLQRVGTWEASNTTVEALIEGVDLVERKLFQALQSAGLEGVDPTGERFDPNTMEAMMKVPAEDEASDNQVHQVFQKGYTFKGQLVRPARVSVLTHD